MLSSWIFKVGPLSFLLVSANIFSANSSSAPITLLVPKSTKLSVSGNPGVLKVSGSGPGPVEVSDNSTTYTLHSNLKTSSNSLKIAGALSGENLPDGVTLFISLASRKGTSTGKQPLSTTPVDLVTGLYGKIKEQKLPITYTFKVDSIATTPTLHFTRAVILTVTSES